METWLIWRRKDASQRATVHGVRCQANIESAARPASAVSFARLEVGATQTPQGARGVVYINCMLFRTAWDPIADLRQKK